MIDIHQYRAAIGGFRCRGRQQEKDDLQKDLEEVEKIRRRIRKLKKTKNKTKSEDPGKEKKSETSKMKKETPKSNSQEEKSSIVNNIIHEILEKVNNNRKVIEDELVKAGVETNPGPGPYGEPDEMEGSKRIAQEIMEAVLRCQLPFILDRLTPGDGNCFSHAVLAQLKRKEIYEMLSENIKKIANKGHVQYMKICVCQFALQFQHPRMIQFKQSYIDHVQPVDKVTWNQYWLRAQALGKWADNLFVQVTAWLCNTDIIILSTSNTLTRPYITISGNLDNEDIATRSPPLILGTKTNLHYQSLLPEGQIIEEIREVADVFRMNKEHAKRSAEEEPSCTSKTKKMKTRDKCDDASPEEGSSMQTRSKEMNTDKRKSEESEEVNVLIKHNQDKISAEEQPTTSKENKSDEPSEDVNFIQPNIKFHPRKQSHGRTAKIAREAIK